MTFDYTQHSAADIYKLMSQTVIPRPIAWIVTEYNSIINVAPFSYFTALSSNPPTLIVSIGHKSDGTPKDTLRNLRKTRRCTVCIVPPKQLETMHFTSKALDATVSEAEFFDLPLRPLIADYPPMIDAVPVAFACELHSEIVLDGSQTIPLVLQIHHQFIDDAHVNDARRLDIAFDPIARVGKRYAHLGDPVDPPPFP